MCFMVYLQYRNSLMVHVYQLQVTIHILGADNGKCLTDGMGNHKSMKITVTEHRPGLNALTEPIPGWFTLCQLFSLFELLKAQMFCS